jgi:hypothetical protein
MAGYIVSGGDTVKQRFGKLTAEVARVHGLAVDLSELHEKELEVCKKEATSCWVEVYDKHPAEKTAERLRCGYMTEADDKLWRLSLLLPLEEWDTVYCCRPGEYLKCTNLVETSQHRTDDSRREHVRNWVQERLESTQTNQLIFPDDRLSYKQQLVIVKRKHLT